MPSDLFHIEDEQGRNVLTVSMSTKRFDINTLTGLLSGA